jgi:hypothetical protein
MAASFSGAQHASAAAWWQSWPHWDQWPGPPACIITDNNCQLAQLNMIGFSVVSGQGYQGKRWRIGNFVVSAGSQVAVSPGAPVTLEWSCQNHTDFYSGGVCDNRDGFGNCIGYSGRQSSSIVRFTSSSGSGFTTGGALYGAATVYPTQATTYTLTCSGQNGANGSVPLSIVMGGPVAGQPSATIVADSPSIQVGQTTGIHATFTAGSNDTLVADNVDSPVGTGLGSNTNPGPKDITFTPSTAGTYTFYARVKTASYDWQTEATVVVTVTAAAPPGVPSGLSASCNAAGTSVTTSWDAVSGADHYWAGLDDTTNNSAACQSGWMCTTPPDYSANVTTRGGTIGVTPGHAMRLLVSSCTAGNICSAAAEKDFTCNQPTAALSITANGQTGLANIPVNTPVVVAWQADNVQAGSCRVTNNGDSASWTGESGSQTVAPLSASRIYTLSCNKTDGTAAAPATVSVGVQPGSIDGPLTATPGRVPKGTAPGTKLSWHTSGMTDCSLDANTIGHVSSALVSSGISKVIPAETTFTLTCHDGTHTFVQSVDVGVLPSFQEI